MPLSVLYVEDDPNDVFFFERAVESSKLDVNVRSVADGDIALEWLAGHGMYSARNVYPMPDVLVLDLKLPRMNGFSVLDAIRRGPPLKNLTIVVYSSSLQRKDVNETLANGASRFIGKTSDCAELICYLRSRISQRLMATKPTAAQFANPSPAVVRAVQ